MKRGRITREHVAARAGVSTAVVSHVLNDDPRPVSTGTRARVEAAIRELGYYPNELARSLRVQSTSTIGLIILNIKNPVYAEVAESLRRVCLEAGYLVLLCSSGRDPSLERRFVHILRAKQADELPKRETGSEAARMILALAGHLRETSSRTLTLPVRLVVRASTAEPRLAA